MPSERTASKLINSQKGVRATVFVLCKLLSSSAVGEVYDRANRSLTSDLVLNTILI